MKILYGEYSEISKLVSEYLKEKGFEITEKSIPQKENTILINNLIPELKLFWDNKKFHFIQELKVE